MAANGDDKTPRPGQISPEDREAFRTRSKGLGQRLDEISSRKGAKERPDQDGRGVAYGQAVRIAAELIGGIIFGVALGWSLDHWLGTTPFLLIVFVMLGFAAGLLNVIRGARKAQELNEPAQMKAPSVKDDEDN